MIYFITNTNLNITYNLHIQTNIFNKIDKSNINEKVNSNNKLRMERIFISLHHQNRPRKQLNFITLTSSLVLIHSFGNSLFFLVEQLLTFLSLQLS